MGGIPAQHQPCLQKLAEELFKLKPQPARKERLWQPQTQTTAWVSRLTQSVCTQELVQTQNQQHSHTEGLKGFHTCMLNLKARLASSTILSLVFLSKSKAFILAL